MSGKRDFFLSTGHKNRVHYKELYSLLMIIANQWPCCEFLIKKLIFWMCSKLMSLLAIQLKVIRMRLYCFYTLTFYQSVCAFLADPLGVVKCLTFSSFLLATPVKSHTHTHTHTHTHYIKNKYSDQQTSVSASSCSEQGELIDSAICLITKDLVWANRLFCWIGVDL